MAGSTGGAGGQRCVDAGEWPGWAGGADAGAFLESKLRRAPGVPVFVERGSAPGTNIRALAIPLARESSSYLDESDIPLGSPAGYWSGEGL